MTARRIDVEIRADAKPMIQELRRASAAMRTIASMFGRPARPERILWIELGWPPRVYWSRPKFEVGA